MPVPKRKRSRARRDKRFANWGIKPKTFTACANCKDPLMPHVACKTCGFYKGKKVLRTKYDRTEVRTELKKVKKEAEGTPKEPVVQGTESK